MELKLEIIIFDKYFQSLLIQKEGGDLPWPSSSFLIEEQWLLSAECRVITRERKCENASVNLASCVGVSYWPASSSHPIFIPKLGEKWAIQFACALSHDIHPLLKEEKKNFCQNRVSSFYQTFFPTDWEILNVKGAF